MLGRCQHTLYRGLLAALQPQQQCVQLEVLAGLQSVRSKTYWRSNDRLPAADRIKQRRNVTVTKLLDKLNPPPTAASLGGANIPFTPPPLATSSSSSSSDSGISADASPATTDSSSSSRTAVSQQHESTESKTTTWMPAWLDGVMGNRRRRSSGPSTASPLQSSPAAAAVPAAAAGAVAGDSSSSSSKKPAEDDDWAPVLARRNMSLDEYQQLVLKQEYNADSSEPGPRPVRPRGLGNPTAAYHDKFDYERLEHARHVAHYNIISTMSPEDKQLALHHTEACIKDKAWINKLAQVAQVQPTMVLDLLRTYHKYRQSLEMLFEHKEAGNTLPIPSDGDNVQGLLKLLKERKAKKDVEPLLALRDPDNCELTQWFSAWKNTGQGSVYRPCPRTGLPYVDCCGALFKLPQHMKRLGKKPRARRAIAR